MDKYLGFKYNGVEIGIDKESPSFPGFIKNDGLDLRFFGVPNFTNERIEMLYGNSSYYTGTTISHKEIPLQLSFKEITLNQYREILKLFDVKGKGKLIFDFNEDYGFNVKPETIEEISFQVVSGTTDKYNVDLDITFSTVNDWAATYKDNSITTLEWNGSNWEKSSEEGLSFIGESLSGSFGDVTFSIENTAKIENYLEIEFSSVFKLTVEEKTIEIESGDAPFTYYSKYGIVIDNNGKFVGEAVEQFILQPGETYSIQLENCNQFTVVYSARDLI